MEVQNLLDLATLKREFPVYLFSFITVRNCVDANVTQFKRMFLIVIVIFPLRKGESVKYHEFYLIKACLKR